MKCGDCGNTQPALPGFPNCVFCDYYHLHKSNLVDASHCEHFKAKILTNADRIRAMDDKELAKHVCCPYDQCIDLDAPCDKCVLSWLKSPVEVDE